MFVVCLYCFEVKRCRRFVYRRRLRNFAEASAVFISDKNVVRLHERIQVRDIRLVDIRFRVLDVERPCIAVDEHGLNFQFASVAGRVCHQSIPSSVIFVVDMYWLSDIAKSISANCTSCSFVAVGFT